MPTILRVTWTFSKKADTVNTDDLVIEATAPADRGGHTKIWGYVEGTSGKVKKLAPIHTITLIMHSMMTIEQHLSQNATSSVTVRIVSHNL